MPLNPLSGTGLCCEVYIRFYRNLNEYQEDLNNPTPDNTGTESHLIVIASWLWAMGLPNSPVVPNLHPYVAARKPQFHVIVHLSGWAAYAKRSVYSWDRELLEGRVTFLSTCCLDLCSTNWPASDGNAGIPVAGGKVV